MLLLLVMLFLVLWLVLGAVLVALCRMAARGDRALSAAAQRPRSARRSRRARTREDRPAVVSRTAAPALSRHAARPRFTMRGSQTAASDDVREGAQEDLDVRPERPVGHVQVVHHRHLP
jgi:hypothetical protein